MEMIPEYSLSHYIEKGNKVYMGTLSLADDRQVVSAVSSAKHCQPVQPLGSAAQMWGNTGQYNR